MRPMAEPARPLLAPVGSLAALAASFRRSLRAANRSRETVATYGAALELFRRYLERRGAPTEARAIRQEHVEGFLAELFERGLQPTTALTRLRGLRAFFRWAAREGEVDDDPAAGVEPPKVPEQPVRMPDDAEVKKLLAVCEGAGFLDRRDRALIVVLVDCGLRRGELLGLRVEDLDLDQGLIHVHRGKGGARRVAPIGNAATAALDRYLRARARHKLADLEAVWLSGYGPLTPSAVAKLLIDRCRAAGIAPLHPHALKHYSVHRFLSAGGTESSAQRIYGWRSAQMLTRYGAARGVERAIAEHRRLGVADALWRTERS